MTRENRQAAQDPMPVFFVLLFFVALMLRVCFVLQWQMTPYGDAPQLDADMYDKWAWRLAQGGADDAGVYYQSPLYPWLLSFVYRVAGHSYPAAGLFNAFLDSLTVVGLSVIARLSGGNKAAALTGILAALFAPMVFYTAAPMKESLTLFLMTACVVASLWALRATGWRRYGAAGVICGLAVLARGNALFLLPVLPFFAWRYYGRRAVAPCLAFVAGVAVAIAPVTLHNWRAAHDIVPITSDGGFNLYIGHSPYANGTNAYPPEVATGPDQERLDTAWVAEQQTGHALKPSQISAFWRDKAIDYARHHPAREVELLGLKFLAFFNDADRFDNYDFGFIRRHFPSVVNMLPRDIGVITALAIFAFILAWRTGGVPRDMVFLAVCAVVYTASVLVFYVTDRYRLPVIVFLLPLAGCAWPYAVAAWREKRKTALTVAACGAVVTLALAFMPALDAVDHRAFDWEVLEAIADAKGDDDAVLRDFEKAESLSPVMAGAQAFVRAATVYEKRGQAARAEKLIDDAVALFPQDGIALYNKGRLQALRGDIDGALATMRAAQKLTPTYGLIYYALARLYDRKGDAAAAQAAIEQGLEIDPSDSRLLALIHAQNGD
ncbi:MAG: glycosyltransferase family 39 protein [Alphaproteobacteria bacterium]|nr:glycosyltransferase family 39 protein [Alphaproteobacteria bacterium]